MNKLLLAVAAAGVAIVWSATPASADSVKGTVVAYDRVAGRIVLSDDNVFYFDDAVEIPESLNAGDEVEIDFEFDDEETGDRVESITIVTEGDDEE